MYPTMNFFFKIQLMERLSHETQGRGLSPGLRNGHISVKAFAPWHGKWIPKSWRPEIRSGVLGEHVCMSPGPWECGIMSNSVHYNQCPQCLSGHAIKRSIFLFIFLLSGSRTPVWLSVINIHPCLQTWQAPCNITIIWRRNNTTESGFLQLLRKESRCHQHRAIWEPGGKQFYHTTEKPSDRQFLPGRRHWCGDSSKCSSFHHDEEFMWLRLEVIKVHVHDSLSADAGPWFIWYDLYP